MVELIKRIKFDFTREGDKILIMSETTKPQLVTVSLTDRLSRTGLVVPLAFKQTLTHVPEGGEIPPETTILPIDLGWAVVSLSNVICSATGADFANHMQRTGGDYIQGANIGNLELANLAIANSRTHQTSSYPIRLPPISDASVQLAQTVIEIPKTGDHYVQTLEAVPTDNELLTNVARCGLPTALIWLAKCYIPTYQNTPIGKQINTAVSQISELKYEELPPEILNLLVAAAGYLSKNPFLTR